MYSSVCQVYKVFEYTTIALSGILVQASQGSDTLEKRNESEHAILYEHVLFSFLISRSTNPTNSGFRGVVNS